MSEFPRLSKENNNKPRNVETCKLFSRESYQGQHTRIYQNELEHTQIKHRSTVSVLNLNNNEHISRYYSYKPPLHIPPGRMTLVDWVEVLSYHNTRFVKFVLFSLFHNTKTTPLEVLVMNWISQQASGKPLSL